MRTTRGLYVPMERMDLVQAYHSLGEAEAARWTGWAARRGRRASRACRNRSPIMADKLLELYAERKAMPGFAFPPDTPWQREFEDAFEFSETADQATAIADIKRDMERPQPMDRLLCGDVGYGKTEVAMRAAFKAAGRSQAGGGAGADDGAGVSALRNVSSAHGGVSRANRDAQPLSQRARAEKDDRGDRSGQGGYRHRYAPAAVART